MKRIIASTLSLLFLLSVNYCLATGAAGGYIQNPLGTIYTPESLVQKVLALTVRVGTVLAVLFLIYSGYLFVVARGNSGKIEKARDTFMWTIIGIAILLGAQVISSIVVGTISSISN